MVKKSRFKEVSFEKLERKKPIPGDIYLKCIKLNKEEMNAILEQMSHFLFKHKHEYSYINWEHSESDEESKNDYSYELVDINESYKPLYLIKDKSFYGLSVVIKEKLRGTFLISGKTFGKTEAHYSDSYGHTDEDDDYYYSMVKKD